MTMRIVVDYGLCDDNDGLHLLREDVAAGERETVERAIRSCPKAALRIGS